MTFVSYAQNFEDVLLWRALGHLPTGFYIDVGASHPDIDSVTRAFYDRGWHGINVEPTAASYQRLVAARPRDRNLQMALAATASTATLYGVTDTDAGLSTLDACAVARYRELGMEVQQTTIETGTLAAICRAHAPADIHFLKIDVEGFEREVLAGADFELFRPWIVLAEATAPMTQTATHATWEPILSQARYRFVWFDGLNRYYIAEERHAELAAHFRSPPNVFDDFLRVADTDWARRIAEAEARAEAVMQRATAAELRAAFAEDRAEAANLRLVRTGTEAARSHTLASMRAELIATLEQRSADEVRHAARVAEDALQRAEAAEQERIAAAAWLDAMRRSTSWRVTGPLRRVMRLRGGAEPAPTPSATPPPGRMLPETSPPANALPPTLLPAEAFSRAPPRRAVHQFHSGTAYGDAITNAMLLTRQVLRGLGYDSRIYAEHLDPALRDEIHALDHLPDHDDFVLIVRHSMGHDALPRILGRSVPKVLLYHNITPPELLDDAPYMQRYARLGREQLATLRPEMAAALADSEYNAMELRRAGFRPVAACSMLFDLDAMLAQARQARRTEGGNPVFSILFVGRITAAKGQLELVAAYARFRALYAGQSRLVLVGRHDGGGPYLEALLALIRRHRLDTGAVEITGLVPDAALQQHYADADLYVSASQHEGFGVPLIEAIAQGVPVLAVAAGAVPYTLADPASLLPDATPAGIAMGMLALATDPQRRAALAARQRAGLPRFGLDRHIPALVAALTQAGAECPVDQGARAALMANARYTVAGHVNGSYSLAAINRSLALALEAARPGAVRLLPVEGDLTTDVDRIPGEQRDRIGALLARPAPATGPELVISQHYPVWVPPNPGDLPLALFFWEETLVPAATIAALNDGFRGVLAPTRAVAKSLLDSGLRIPVRVVGLAPPLEAFRRLRDERAAAPRNGPFTFLHVSSCFPRKGVDVLLAAYARAFRHGDDVRLIMKGFANPHNTVAADLARLQHADPGLAPVTLIDDDFGSDALLGLFRDADAVVLPSRGEGYNLPAAEALAAGIPLIVTGWGGHMDFIPLAAPNAARLLRFSFGPSGSHLATPFSLWAEPDADDLVAALQDAAGQGRAAPPTDTSRPDDIAGAISAFAADLLLGPPPLAPSVGWVTTWDVRCGVAEYSRHLVGAVPGPATIFADLRTATPDDTVLRTAAPDNALLRTAAPDDTVLRTAAPDDTVLPRIRPSWKVGDPAGLPMLTGAILRHDPRALVIQHQPGLFPWAGLPALLDHPALGGRVVCVTLHNTQDLVEAPAPVRAAAVAALGRMSRVVVHTLRDMNTLAGLGLAANLTLIPHGADPPVEALPPAALDPSLPVLIGSYGFFLPGKGIPELIAALTILRRNWPLARLRLVNAEYPLAPSACEIEACRAQVAEAGLDDAVAFETGFLAHADATALLRDCDLLTLPYQRSKEGSSAALRSAFAAAVPVAVTPLRLFDEAAGATLRLPGTDPASIAAGLDAALRDQAARAAAVAAAQAWLLQRDWPSVGRRWHAMLEALSNSGIVVGGS